MSTAHKEAWSGKQLVIAHAQLFTRGLINAYMIFTPISAQQCTDFRKITSCYLDLLNYSEIIAYNYSKIACYVVVSASQQGTQFLVDTLLLAVSSCGAGRQACQEGAAAAASVLGKSVSAA